MTLTWEEVKESYLMTVEDALVACFGQIASGDGETEGYKVECCGDIRYGSGIIGSDIAQCKRCGRKILNILSPHVSPALINNKTNTTGIPTAEMFEELGERCWLAIIDGEYVKNGESTS